MKKATRTVLALALVGCFAACGSSDDKSLFSSGGSSAGGTASGGMSGSSGSGAIGGAGASGGVGGVAGSFGGASTGGASSGGASTGGASSGGASTGGASSGGASTGGSGGAQTDPSCKGHCGKTSPVSGSEPECYCDTTCVSSGDCCKDYDSQCSQGQVDCGSVHCDSKSEYCCQKWTGKLPYQPSCIKHENSCTGPDVHCDSSSDCKGGEVCCGTLNSGSNPQYYVELRCKKASSCEDKDERIACGTDTSTCPTGQQCVNSSLLPGYKFCQ